MRRARSTLILLVIFLGVFAYVYFVERKRPTGAEADAKEKVFAVDSATIEELRVKATGGETSVLRKTGGSWQLIEPVATQADASAAPSIASNLGSVEIQRVVDAQPTDLKQYGLDEPRVEIAFRTEGEKDSRRLVIGEKTATGGDLYARRGNEGPVFLIPGYLETTFDRTPFDLRDKTLLHFDREKVDSLEVVTSGQTVRLTKSGSAWSLAAPWRAQADYGIVEGLVGQLGSTQMKSIAEAEATDFKRYGLDRPEITASLGAGSTRATLLVGTKTDEGTFYARDAARPIVFTVESSLIDELKKAPAAYRRKDIFEFRPFNATRIEIARAGETVSFEKDTGAGAAALETWRQATPTARDVDRTKMDDVLSKFANMRAESWVESRARSGFDTPAATVTVQFEEGKKRERVEFGRSGGDTYAAAAGETGAAKVSTSEFDEALKALDVVLKQEATEASKPDSKK